MLENSLVDRICKIFSGDSDDFDRESARKGEKLLFCVWHGRFRVVRCSLSMTVFLPAGNVGAAPGDTEKAVFCLKYSGENSITPLFAFIPFLWAVELESWIL